MRSRLVSMFSDALGTAKIPVVGLVGRYGELGDALLNVINPTISQKYGLELGSFIIENVSVPPEVEQAIDKRAAMSTLGNLNDYVKYQMGQSVVQPGGASGGAGGPMEMAMGFAMAQQMMQGMAAPGARGACGSEPSPSVARPPRPRVRLCRRSSGRRMQRGSSASPKPTSLPPFRRAISRPRRSARNSASPALRPSTSF